MIFPDYAFGHNHRDFFSEAIKAQGGEISALIPIPPTESSFTRYFPQIPAAIGTIISGAFNPEGMAGGFIGVLIVGFQRAAPWEGSPRSKCRVHGWA